jgi:hypothetical protein
MATLIVAKSSALREAQRRIYERQTCAFPRREIRSAQPPIYAAT